MPDKIVTLIEAEVVYHKIFDVVYFSGQGCLKELFGCFIVGTICGVLFFKIWYVFAGIVVIMGIAVIMWGKRYFI